MRPNNEVYKWAPLIVLYFGCVGVSIFLVFVSAHESVLEEALREHGVLDDGESLDDLDASNRDSDEMGSPFDMPRPSGPAPDHGSADAAPFLIQGNVLQFVPPLSGREEDSIVGHVIEATHDGAPLLDQELIRAAAKEIVELHHRLGSFAYSVSRVEFKTGSSTPWLGKVEGKTADFVIVIQDNRNRASLSRQLSHEVTHLVDPFLYSWFAEGVAEVRAAERLLWNHPDVAADVESRFTRDGFVYSLAHDMVRRMEYQVGRKKILALLRTTKKRDWRAKNVSDRSRWGRASAVDLERWLQLLTFDDRQACVRIIEAFAPRLAASQGDDHPEVILERH